MMPDEAVDAEDQHFFHGRDSTGSRIARVPNRCTNWDGDIKTPPSSNDNTCNVPPPPQCAIKRSFCTLISGVDGRGAPLARMRVRSTRDAKPSMCVKAPG